MTALMNWISPSAMHALGWALLHFLWQGTALAALAAVAIALCRRTSSRYLIGVAMLALMLLAPLATFFLYLPQHSANPAGPSPLAVVARPIAKSLPPVSSRLANTSPSLDAIPWLVEAWLLGVVLLSLRSAGGFFWLERERRRQSSVVSAQVLEICHTLQDRLGIDRAIQYCECKWLQAPAVIGWFRPIVFLPVSALTGLSEDQLHAVIAHELAHIQRFDPFVNIFQVFVETLLFYHPAVWWLNQRIRAEREHCCDETAVAVCGDAVQYARALTLMEEWRTAPAFAMAANRGPLTERIVRVLGLKTIGAGMRGVGLTGSLLCLTAALAAGNALLGVAHPRTARASFIAQATPVSSAQEPAAKPSTPPKPSAAQSANPAPASNPAPSNSSYIDGMKAAGLTNPSLDELIELKIQGVTPEYVRQMQDLGLHPDADGLVGMKVQGVTPEYIKEMRALGFNPDMDQIIGMKVQGVTPEYVKGMKDVGIQADADDIVGLKVQGVTPDYVREMRAAGLKVDADDVVGMKVQGVTPAYVQGLKAQGIEPNSDDVVGMKVQGVTPEYISDIRALGFKPSADEIVSMKVQGVTPEFIKSLQAAGFKPSIDDIVGAKVQGITPEFIDQARKHGFQNLTIEKLIELKRLGILDSKAEL